MAFDGPDGSDTERLDAALYQDGLSHVKATDIFIGLKYWARATRYEPTPGEREVLEEGTARSGWKTLSKSQAQGLGTFPHAG